ncbi:MAG: type II toxin-antitoxin system Phd/YefM family antitoxin [Microgenomates group bacterium]
MRKQNVSNQLNTMVAKTVSVTEAKSKLSELFDWAVKNKDEIIVENRGNPKAVIVSYEYYEELLALGEKSRRQEAMQKLCDIAQAVNQSKTTISKKESEEIADKISREAIRNLSKKGKVHFSQ